MDIIIAAGSTLPTPQPGYKTLFINTEDNNILSWKDSNGVVTRFGGQSDGDDCCACDIAKIQANAWACALKSGVVTPAQYNAWILQGVKVTETKTDDGQGNTTCEVAIGPQTPIVVPTELAIIPADDTLSVAATLQLYPQFTPLNTTNQGVIWISSNPAIATVSPTGLVTGVALGAATIYAYSVADNTISASRLITVS